MAARAAPGARSIAALPRVEHYSPLLCALLARLVPRLGPRLGLVVRTLSARLKEALLLLEVVRLLDSPTSSLSWRI